MDNRVALINQQEYNASFIAEKIEKEINIDECRKVFIKPNMVIDPWRGEENLWVATVTNASLIEAVLMVLKKKAHSKLEVVIGDAPMARSNHEITLKRLRLKELVQKYNQGYLTISLIDIREWHWKYVLNMCVSRKKLQGDPKGVKLVNLSSDSAFAAKKNKNYEAFDDIHPVSEFHNQSDNIFSISASILDCDLFINLPKMKTHRIAGMTCAMKNLVGINSNKNCVPHNTCGSDQEGGDTFKQGAEGVSDEMKGFGGLARRVFRKKNPILNYCMIPVKLLYDVVSSSEDKIGYGMWYGNDTIWRSIIDLNRIIIYCDSDGNMRDTQQRKYVCITDAIISGEGEGPLHPTPKRTNLLLVSHNPVANDLVAAEIMGLDWKKIPSLYNALNKEMNYPLVDFEWEDIHVQTKDGEVGIGELSNDNLFKFCPTKGWIGHIEK